MRLGSVDAMAVTLWQHSSQDADNAQYAIMVGSIARIGNASVCVSACSVNSSVEEPSSGRRE